jgi:hypothetical protein
LDFLPLGQYLVVNLIALSLHIQYQRSGLSFDVAHKVVVIVDLELRHELDLNGDLRLSWHRA